ncbi:ArsR/SmtB family transcription factor [Nocardiopsis halophila]|uniref:ArsR/SmtB family transcription factor n=1 Tax=Nocardiopsis halophila TaxID=141692 RepID=UPI0003454233|nr:helix-turn-helix domain-containing protein [Nocardiopsis halophila]
METHDRDDDPAPSRGDVGPPQQREVDVETLRGLAHPLRMKLLEELAIHGPSTATALGARLGESSGSTSYHLRMLSRYGLVEDDPDHAPGGRERWWRRIPGGLRMRGFDRRRDPATREAAGVVLDEIERGRHERQVRWRAFTEEHPEESAPWIDASTDSDYVLLLTRDETAELTADLAALMNEWRRRTLERDRCSHPHAVPVETQIFTFPHLRAPGSAPVGGSAPESEERAPIGNGSVSGRRTPSPGVSGGGRERRGPTP